MPAGFSSAGAAVTSSRTATRVRLRMGFIGRLPPAGLTNMVAAAARIATPCLQGRSFVSPTRERGVVRDRRLPRLRVGLTSEAPPTMTSPTRQDLEASPMQRLLLTL